ncbi:YqaA family protein [Comamonas resistens]|uniref:YqaA family protein n=1 Tax=Comamonas resistens TaxID=3046670 RepID=A0ABY8SNR5_9BURK|nr:YqaA family protein [Comamonas resistens]MDL5036391.1 YqaA family protein [Comamonas resistens]WHS64737.1 YqaA family protein [Comamonas resistens]
MQQVLHWLALPELGLSTVFIVALVSATLLPLGSEPVVAALVTANPHLFWPAIMVATAGNTIGGAISWWMGLAAHKAWNRARRLRQHDGTQPQRKNMHNQSRWHRVARYWLRKYGAKACLLSWLPVVGDPLCAVAGWLRLPFWACVGYMAVGKFLRYTLMTAGLHQILQRIF